MTKRRHAAMFTALMVLVGVAWGQKVIQSPNQNLSLAERWSWAASEGASAAGKEFWIGYSVKRLMSEDSYINSGSMHFGGRESRRSLYDILSGDAARATAGSNSWKSGDRANIIKVVKEVAILFKLSGDRTEEGSMRKIEITNMELSVDLKDVPLVWLGAAGDDQSIQLLKQVYGSHSSNDLRRELITVVGLHQNAKESQQFLTKILQSDQQDNVRAQAAFWLSQQGQPDCLPVLLEAAQKDRSAKVRDQSVFAISQLPSDESTDALIDLARKAANKDVRSKAAFWLGQKASQKAVATLETIIADDEETDVQRQALFALSRIKSESGIDRLIKIAQTHRNPRIRKQAIQCLGQSEDPRALDALIAIVKK